MLCAGESHQLGSVSKKFCGNCCSSFSAANSRISGGFQYFNSGVVEEQPVDPASIATFVYVCTVRRSSWVRCVAASDEDVFRATSCILVDFHMIQQQRFASALQHGMVQLNTNSKKKNQLMCQFIEQEFLFAIFD